MCHPAAPAPIASAGTVNNCSTLSQLHVRMVPCHRSVLSCERQSLFHYPSFCHTSILWFNLGRGELKLQIPFACKACTSCRKGPHIPDAMVPCLYSTCRKASVPLQKNVCNIDTSEKVRMATNLGQLLALSNAGADLPESADCWHECEHWQLYSMMT